MGRGLRPTRGALRELEERIELAERALEILERRRDVLVMELQDTLDQLQFVRRSLSGTYEDSRSQLDVAWAREGGSALRGAARARSDAATVSKRTRNVMGVELPEFDLSPLSRSPETRGYGLIGTGSAIDETARSHEILLERIVRAAEVEASARLLLDEVTKLFRRVNALQYKLLPELRDQRDEIRRRLEERERQEIVTRKWVKDHVMHAEEEREDREVGSLWEPAGRGASEETPEQRSTERASDQSERADVPPRKLAGTATDLTHPDRRDSRRAGTERRDRLEIRDGPGLRDGPALHGGPATAERWANQYFGGDGDPAEPSHGDGPDRSGPGTDPRDRDSRV